MLLLVIRAAVLLLAGMAAAGPLWQATGSNKVVLAVIGAGIAVDTATNNASVQRVVNASRVVTAPVAERRDGATHADAIHDDAAVWPVAWRAAARLMPTLSPTDSLELHLFVRDGDALNAPGWDAWRSTWPGHVVMHSLPLADREPVSKRRIVIVNGDTASGASLADDMVMTALQWHAARLNGASIAVDDSGTGVQTDGVGASTFVDTVLVYRNNGYAAPTTAELSPNALNRASETIRLYWPRDGVPRGFAALSTADSGRTTATALVAAGQAIVAPFSVHALPNHVIGQEYRDLVWFGDGRVAAEELRAPRQCVRSVAVTIASTSDLLFGPSANGIFNRLLSQCARPMSVALTQLTRADTQSVAGLLQTDRDQNVSGRALPVVRDFARQAGIPLNRPSRNFLLPALLASALVLLIVEGRLRARAGDVS